jgi:hypothetical protein
MGYSVITEFVPNATGIPVVDSKYIKGGFLTVSDLTERNNIPSTYRREGMIVALSNASGSMYQLVGGVLNSNWAEFNFKKSFSGAYAGTGWMVNHNLGFEPNFKIRTYDGGFLEGDFTHVNNNTLSLSFTVNVSGIIYCS